MNWTAIVIAGMICVTIFGLCYIDGKKGGKK